MSLSSVRERKVLQLCKTHGESRNGSLQFEQDECAKIIRSFGSSGDILSLPHFAKHRRGVAGLPEWTAGMWPPFLIGFGFFARLGEARPGLARGRRPAGAQAGPRAQAANMGVAQVAAGAAPHTHTPGSLANKPSPNPKSGPADGRRAHIPSEATRRSRQRPAGWGTVTIGDSSAQG